MNHEFRNWVLVVLSIFLSVAAHADNAKILRHDRPVAGRWMVALKTPIPMQAVDGVITSIAATYDLNVSTRWTERMPGFICDGATEKAIARLASDPRVDLIEQDAYIVLAGSQWTIWNGQYLWDLDRVDEPTYWQSDSTYDMCPEGRAVYAYVLDLGVRADHEQFTIGEPSSRVVLSRTFDNGTAQGAPDTTNGCAASANAWHGTAVASKLAGTQIGTSKAHVVSLRVFTCPPNNSQVSWIVNALQWIRSTNDPYRWNAGVVNWSGGLDPTTMLNDKNMITNTVRALVTGTRIPFFVAANNFAGDACMFTPQSLAYTNVDHNGVVFTVGGTSVGAGADRNDYRWQEWTNGVPEIGIPTAYPNGAGSDGGRCVSIYAPAVGIYAARNSGTAAYGYASGTSFSTPLVAGIAARYIERTGRASYIDVYNYLLNAAQSTGTIVNNVNTVEYWMCRQGFSYLTYRNPISTCPSGSFGMDGTSTPVHMVPTYNESGAGMIYSDMTCP